MRVCTCSHPYHRVSPEGFDYCSRCGGRLTEKGIARAITPPAGGPTAVRHD